MHTIFLDLYFFIIRHTWRSKYYNCIYIIYITSMYVFKTISTRKYLIIIQV